jgi:hypothetical protein
MGRILVPVTIVAAMAAFAVAAILAGFAPYQPSWWAAAVRLAVLGGIVPMIYAVTIRIVPVFSRRKWQSEGWLRLQVALAIAGAWTTATSQAAGWDPGLVAGNGLALAGGIVYTVNIARLFRQPAGQVPALPLPDPNQTGIDRIATVFTRLSGIYLLVGLVTGFVTSWWQPDTGRWDLVWAHALLVGFFLSMAAGVCYHVLARWTGRRWRWHRPIRLHLLMVAYGLPFMLIALATDWLPLFAIAGPLQAAGVVLLLVNIAPMLGGLPALTRVAVALAGACLATGVGFGAVFAIDAAVGARLRFFHAELNLFGWTGLLVCGVGYYLIPRLLGRPLRWPRLAVVQVACLATGAIMSALSQAWRAYGGGSPELVATSHALVALAFVLFGALIAFTVRGVPARGTVAAVQLRPGRGTNVTSGANAR